MGTLEQKIISHPSDVDVISLGDRALGESLECGNFDAAADVLRIYRSLNHASSLGAAKLLHGVNSNWTKVEHEEGDTFLSWAVRETGYDAQTIKKRLCEWEFLNGNYIPKKHRSRINDYTVRQLDKVYSICVNATENKEGGYLNFVEEDYEISENQWLKLSEAIDENMVADVVREVKDKEKNSNHMSLKIDPDGVIWVYQGKSSETVGQLFTEKTVELVEKAIRRICENSGIVPRSEY